MKRPLSASRPMTTPPLAIKKNHPLLKKPPVKDQQALPPRPEWNSNITDNPFKVSHAEIL